MAVDVGRCRWMVAYVMMALVNGLLQLTRLKWCIVHWRDVETDVDGTVIACFFEKAKELSHRP